MRSNKKLLLISGTPATSFGSVERSYIELCKYLVNFDYEVYFIFTEEGIVSEHLKKIGVKVFFVRMHKKIDPVAILKIFQILKKVNPNVVHIHFELALYNSLFSVFFFRVTSLLKHKNLSLIIHHHSFPLKRGTSWKYAIRRTLYKLLNVYAVFVSEAQKNVLVNMGVIPSNIKKLSLIILSIQLYFILGRQRRKKYVF